MQAEVDKYILDIRAFVEREDRQILIGEALARLDEERVEKARRIRQEKGLAASLGAGLLLQFAVRRAEAERAVEAAGRAESVRAVEAAGRAEAVRIVESERKAEAERAAGSVRTADSALVQCTVPGLLESLEVPLPFAFRYGQGGKPYFKNYPYYFNLSHSGDYVVCALSEREVGIDLQEHRGAAFERVAQRYFSSAEVFALMHAQDRAAFFFRLWARKEAYGKLSGRGIMEVAGKDLWSGGTEADGGEALCFEEYDGLQGYSMAVCRFAGI